MEAGERALWNKASNEILDWGWGGGEVLFLKWDYPPRIDGVGRTQVLTLFWFLCPLASGTAGRPQGGRRPCILRSSLATLPHIIT